MILLQIYRSEDQTIVLNSSRLVYLLMPSIHLTHLLLRRLPIEMLLVMCLYHQCSLLHINRRILHYIFQLVLLIHMILFRLIKHLLISMVECWLIVI